MRSRGYRWVVVGVVAAIGLLAALDVVALQVFESRGGSQIAQTMAAEEASLDLGGFPFLPNYLRGRLGTVGVDVTGASGGGLRVASVETGFSDARFDASDMFALLRNRFATRTAFTGKDVFARIEVASDDLESFLRSRIPLVQEVRIATSGVEVFLGSEDGDEREDDEDEEERPARFLPDVEGRRLVLVATGRAGFTSAERDAIERIETAIDLPMVPEGLQTDVQLGDREFVVEASGPEVTLDIGEGGERGVGGPDG